MTEALMEALIMAFACFLECYLIGAGFVMTT